MIYCKKCKCVFTNVVEDKYKCECNNVFSIGRNCYTYISSDLSIGILVFYNRLVIYNNYEKEINLDLSDLFNNKDPILSEIIYGKVFERINKIIDNMIFE